MNTSAPRRPAVRQAGLTLVELMVALAIGLFLTLGLTLMMSDTSRTFKIQDDYARMQENAVSSVRFLSDSLRHAGFFGQAASTILLTQRGSISITNNCGSPLQTDVPLIGYPDAASPPGAAPCIKAANFRGGPVLVTRLATGIATFPDPADTAGNFADASVDTGILYVQSDTSSGVVLPGSQLIDAAFESEPGPAGARRQRDGRQFPAFPYQIQVYYVRPCSRPSGGTAAIPLCQSTDDSGRPIPTLVRQELVGTTMVERPLAEGIERLSLSYGLDADGDGVADRFKLDPGAAEWEQVVSVRVTLLVRSLNPDQGQDDSAKDYDLDGDGTKDFNCNDVVATEPLACRYKRTTFSQLIQVRNLAFRRGA